MLFTRVSDITGILQKMPQKQFPGDHGLMLIIFAAFVWRYAGFRYFCGGGFADNYIFFYRG